MQLRWPEYRGGANKVSLIEAQTNYARFGASEAGFERKVRRATDREPLDPGWRPVDDQVDNFERNDDMTGPWPKDYTVLYWWRDEYWRRYSSR